MDVALRRRRLELGGALVRGGRGMPLRHQHVDRRHHEQGGVPMIMPVTSMIPIELRAPAPGPGPVEPLR